MGKLDYLSAFLLFGRLLNGDFVSESVKFDGSMSFESFCDSNGIELGGV